MFGKTKKKMLLVQYAKYYSKRRTLLDSFPLQGNYSITKKQFLFHNISIVY